MLKKCLLIAVAVIILVIIMIRALPDEKKRVANDIKALQKAVQEENRERVLSYIDPAYADEDGMNYDVFRTTIDDLLAKADSIRISLNNMKIRIDSTGQSQEVYATCSLGLRIIARYEGEPTLIYGSVIQPSPVVGYFRKQDKVYRLYGAVY